MKTKNILFLMFILTISVFLCVNIRANASISQYNPNITSRESSDSYTLNGSIVNNMSYGSPTLGNVILAGDIDFESDYLSYNGYSANGIVSFKYNANLNLVSDYDTGWKLEDDNQKSIFDISLDKRINSGVLIIQTSTDAANWTTDKTICDFLSKSNNSIIYTTSYSQILSGSFYRFILAYKICHRTHTGSFWPWDNDKFDYKYCVETSIFYICNNNNSVICFDLMSKEEITSGSSCEYGFSIHKNKAPNTVMVTKPDGSSELANDYAAFTDKGTYTILTTTPFGRKFNQTVIVTKGLTSYGTNKVIAESEDNSGYPIDNSSTSASYSSSTISSVYVAVPSDESIKSDQTSYYSKFGVKNENLMIFLKLNKSNLNSKYSFSNDSWGQTSNQTILGIKTGQVGSGCVIVQKSYDKENWFLAEDGRYSSGIYTTDYASLYNDEMTFVYSPSGDDINKGVFIRLIYAFELYNNNTSKYINVCEIHNFFICNDSVESITFHNLTVDGQMEEILKGEDKLTVNAYSISESLFNRSETCTGFTIDTTLNPNVIISITRDGKAYKVPDNLTIKEKGMYTISVKSFFGTVKTTTIFVTNDTPENIYDFYFPNGFLQGKRIYSKQNYQVYEGGVTSCNIKAPGAYNQALWGKITNLTTGKVENITSNIYHDFFKGLNEPGEYEIVLNTNETFKSDEPSGDNHKFVFRFTLIQEGTAPGPVLNEENLKEFSRLTNASNLYPIYYGVKYSSTSIGSITIAFSDYASAREYAYNYEKGTVEAQPDGSYRYSGSSSGKEKVRYESEYDVINAIYEYVDSIIQVLHFDVSDPFTYTTLSKEVIENTENIRSLYLNNSVVIVSENEVNKLLRDVDIPLINSKKYYILEPGKDGIVTSGTSSFMFIKDEHGYDSYSVSVIDTLGNEHNLKYNVDVESQLKEYGVKTGILTIVEKTAYGDTNEYKVGYINDGDNTASFTLDYYGKNEITEVSINSETSDKSIVTYGFKISNIVDELDPYGLILVSYNGKNEYYCISDLNEKEWLEIGNYVITLINRLGYKYSINLEVIDGLHSVVYFEGELSDKLSTIIYEDEETIELPTIVRYGYNFVGYKASDGTIYNNEIATIMLSGCDVLQTVWEAKKFTLTLMLDGDVYSKMTVEFDKSYSLPKLSLENFDGWGEDGLSQIKITDEGNIELQARFKETPTEEKEDEEKEEEEQQEEQQGMSKKTRTILLIVGIILLAIIIICIIIAVLLSI
ncbi:MAG: hypothetical protein K5765_01205 [Clostridia bacterium]|nr:hypothetical protein [Clostridia bacterium]